MRRKRHQAERFPRMLFSSENGEIERRSLMLI
jgi:hypothetical protein